MVLSTVVELTTLNCKLKSLSQGLQ